LVFWERMKALNLSEIDNFLKEASPLIGAQLQDVIVSKEDVALQFYKEGYKYWLVFVMSKTAPVFFFTEQSKLPIKKQTVPLGLFLKANLQGMTLSEMKRSQEMGRLVNFKFDGGKEAHIEVRLFPHGQNMIVREGKKSISLYKPQELSRLQGNKETEKNSLRTMGEVYNEWLAQRKILQERKHSPKTSRSDKIKKVQRAIDKIQVSLENEKQQHWEYVGKLLVQTQSLDQIPSEYSRYIDREKPLAWNIQNSFDKHKKEAGKRPQTLRRLEELKKQKLELEKISDEDFAYQVSSNQPNKKNIKAPLITGLKSRKKELSSELVVYVGKSAKDNLALLRKARAWDFWFHIKDFPGAHAILFRNKKTEVSEKILYDVAHFLLEVEAERDSSIQKGDRFEFICSEVRHVSPIKGDRLGRVTYKNEKTLAVKF